MLVSAGRHGVSGRRMNHFQRGEIIMNKKSAAGFIALVSGFIFTGCASSTSDIAAVSGFQPEKYMGVWYEIVRLPHYFERGLDYVQLSCGCSAR